MRSGNPKLSSIIFLFFLFWLVIRCFLPLFFPFLLGALLAAAAEPMVSFLHRKLRVPRGISAGIGVSMSFTLLAMLLLSLCAFLLRELGSLANILPDLGETAKTGFSLVRSWLLQLASHSPESIQPVLQQNVENFFSDGTALLDRGIGYLLGLPRELVDKVPIDGLCGKTDEENLGFTYAELDQYIRTGEIEDLQKKERIDSMHKRNLFKLQLMPAFQSGLEIKA